MRRALRVVFLPGLMALAVSPGATGDYAGDDTCGVCHEEVVAAFRITPHATAPGWDADRGCESCHGPGAEHVESGGDPEMIVRLGELLPREAAETCLTCHASQERQFSFKGSIHGLGQVGCTDCHDPHGGGIALLRARGAELCGTCHQAIAAQFDLPRSHPIEDCAGCHEPHATSSFRTSTALFRQVCTECHFEKAGPFLYDHDVVMVDGCASCHEVHGSPNRHLLKHGPQVNLCYQCHSASVTPGWHSAPRFLNEKCTACHTAIHGSNTNPRFLEE